MRALALAKLWVLWALVALHSRADLVAKTSAAWNRRPRTSAGRELPRLEYLRERRMCFNLVAGRQIAQIVDRRPNKEHRPVRPAEETPKEHCVSHLPRASTSPAENGRG